MHSSTVSSASGSDSCSTTPIRSRQSSPAAPGSRPRTSTLARTCDAGTPPESRRSWSCRHRWDRGTRTLLRDRPSGRSPPPPRRLRTTSAVPAHGRRPFAAVRPSRPAITRSVRAPGVTFGVTCSAVPGRPGEMSTERGERLPALGAVFRAPHRPGSPNRVHDERKTRGRELSHAGHPPMHGAQPDRPTARARRGHARHGAMIPLRPGRGNTARSARTRGRARRVRP